jgi:hypothetical protein
LFGPVQRLVRTFHEGIAIALLANRRSDADGDGAERVGPFGMGDAGRRDAVGMVSSACWALSSGRFSPAASPWHEQLVKSLRHHKLRARW